MMELTLVPVEALQEQIAKRESQRREGIQVRRCERGSGWVKG